jgi:prepilin-type N-terminal cleavage/methylation domain-containing protein
MRTRRAQRQRGFTIVENLVALALISISIAGASNLVISAVLGNSAARNYAGVVAEAQSRIDDLRRQSFTSILANFGGSPQSVANNQTVTLNSTSSNSRASYATTLTAIKNSTTGYPQAVRVRIVATQRRGRLNNAQYTFETLIANVS